MNNLKDDLLVRGRRLLSEIYQRCSVDIYEPTSPEEALQDPKWRIALEEEMSMIRKINHEYSLTSLNAGKSLE